MNTSKNTIRLLGAAFLVVFVASMLSGSLLNAATGSGSISDILVSISNNLTLMRISILVELVTSIGIVVLAALLYVVFHKQNKIIALVALGWWLAEAVTLAVSKIGAFALIPLSLEYVKAGVPDSSYFQTLGDFFYYGFDRQGWAIHMLFFCLGGILWYYLFYRSKYIPRVLSVWGLVAVSLVSINVMLVLFDRNIELQMIMLAPYLLFEALIGPWLMVKGIRDGSETR
jgi:Na+/proline symporter